MLSSKRARDVNHARSFACTLTDSSVDCIAASPSRASTRSMPCWHIALRWHRCQSTLLQSASAHRPPSRTPGMQPIHHHHHREAPEEELVTDTVWMIDMLLLILRCRSVPRSQLVSRDPRRTIRTSGFSPRSCDTLLRRSGMCVPWQPFAHVVQIGRAHV